MKEYDKLLELSKIEGTEIYMDTIWLFKRTLGQQIKNADLLIKLLAIDNYFNKNDFGFKIYEEMQRIRTNTNKEIPEQVKKKEWKKEFEDLIKSFEKNGYIKDYPVELSKDFRVFNGSHRLCCALAFNIKKIPVKFTDEYIDRIWYDYSKDWFKANGLSNVEKHIDKKYQELSPKLSLE